MDDRNDEHGIGVGVKYIPVKDDMPVRCYAQNPNVGLLQIGSNPERDNAQKG